jgi:PAS domain S-box-containing protein
MKTARAKSTSRTGLASVTTAEPAGEFAKLRARLAEAEETIRAIRGGEVDVVVVTAKKSVQLFSLEGAEHAYRVLIESMNEGALTLTADKAILYANQCFARMVKYPLEQVIGCSFRRFLSAADRATLRPLLKRAAKSGSKIQVLLKAGDGSQMPVQISIRPTAKVGSNRMTIGMVVTDLTEARRNEEMLRILTQRVVQAQEDERGHVGLELHDNITQLLCAILIRLQALAGRLPPNERATRGEAGNLIKLLGQAADEVQRISGNLRTSILDNLGLVSALRNASSAFVKGTGVPLKLACVQLTAQLPAGTELALYRILQEALRNVEQHAHARHVRVCLTQQGEIVQLSIKDDGIGFGSDHQPAKQKRKNHVGLLGMRERAISVGGSLRIKSALRVGTKIEVRIPLPPTAQERCKLIGG